jgi:hypothetical protein
MFPVWCWVKKSNSVYHVAEVKVKDRPEERRKRYYLKCYRSDLQTALRRDEDQGLIPIKWYSRNKKVKNDRVEA